MLFCYQFLEVLLKQGYASEFEYYFGALIYNRSVFVLFVFCLNYQNVVRRNGKAFDFFVCEKVDYFTVFFLLFFFLSEKEVGGENKQSDKHYVKENGFCIVFHQIISCSKWCYKVERE